jgi:3-oxoacyl-[acyl-carrier-protein] synthase-3
MLENQDFEVFMNGNAVFKHAVQRFPEVIKEALTANGLTKNDIDLLIPHQLIFALLTMFANT